MSATKPVQDRTPSGTAARQRQLARYRVGLAVAGVLVCVAGIALRFSESDGERLVGAVLMLVGGLLFAVFAVPDERRDVVHVVWHESLGTGDEPRRRLIGVFSTWERAEEAVEAARAFPGFDTRPSSSAARVRPGPSAFPAPGTPPHSEPPDAFGIFPEEMGLLGTRERFALLGTTGRWRQPRTPLGDSVWVTGNPRPEDGFLFRRGHVFLGVAASSASAERLIRLRRREVLDPTTYPARAISVPVDTLLWPAGHRERDRPLEALARPDAL